MRVRLEVEVEAFQTFVVTIPDSAVDGLEDEDEINDAIHDAVCASKKRRLISTEIDKDSSCMSSITRMSKTGKVENSPIWERADW